MELSLTKTAKVNSSVSSNKLTQEKKNNTVSI